MKDNLTKAKLRAGETVFGCFVRYADPGLVELLAYQGWDFLVMDAEHGTIEPRDCENLVRAAELHGVTPLVRVTTNLPPVILRFLDTGAQGAHVPWVNSPEEADAAVRAIKYQPRGIRGLGGVRAADYGQRQPLSEYVERANSETLVVIHVETKEAIDRLAETVELEGVDVIFIGPTDLSQSFGVPGNPQHPAVLRAMDRIIEIVSKSSAALGIMTGTADQARQWQTRGARYITITLEALVRQSAQGFLQATRPVAVSSGG